MYQFNLNYIWSNWVGPSCALLLFCAQAWHGKTLSSRNDPIFFCSLHWRNLSLYNKITTTHFKLIRFWWKNVIKFRGKVYSNFFKFVQQLFFLSVVATYTFSKTFCISSFCVKLVSKINIIILQMHTFSCMAQSVVNVGVLCFKTKRYLKYFIFILLLLWKRFHSFSSH